MLLYLHGFCSSPASAKAKRLGEYMAEKGLADRFWCGQLPVSAEAAMALAESVIARSETPPTLMGSSLGGFYATCLAERHGLKAALINPVVLSSVDPTLFLGPQRNFHTGGAFEFTASHVAELRALEPKTLTRPKRYWLLAEAGDEVLDHRAAVRHYAGARQTVLPGGDHSFTRFEDYLEALVTFAGF
ncbi:MAG: esterase [Rhodocyclaceae bacterium]|nr:esterase [Rhodocyclaceae bacterium]